MGWVSDISREKMKVSWDQLSFRSNPHQTKIRETSTGLLSNFATIFTRKSYFLDVRLLQVWIRTRYIWSSWLDPRPLEEVDRTGQWLCSQCRILGVLVPHNCLNCPLLTFRTENTIRLKTNWIIFESWQIFYDGYCK